jgi:hypothetical protein
MSGIDSLLTNSVSGQMIFYELDPRIASAHHRRRWLRVKRFFIAKILRETLDSLPIAFLYYGVPC